jgi:hypothetical protein
MLGHEQLGQAAQALTLITEARERSLDVDCDAYPYTARQQL